MKNKIVALFAMFAFVASTSYAAQYFNNGTEVGHSEEVNCDSSIDCTFSGGKLVFSVAGTLLNKTDDTLTLASSSTIITGTNVPYALIIKHIGGAGADNTGVGTELADGTEGAVLTIVAASIASGSSWKVTPATSTAWDSLTFDAAGERVTLLYVDDTIGWIVQYSTATVNWTL